MTEYIILIPLAILLLGLAPIIARDNYLNKNQKNIMFAIVALIGVLVLQNVADYVLQTTVSAPYLRTLESIVGYTVRPIIIVLFCKLVKPNGKNTIAWILVAVNAAVYLTATFRIYRFILMKTTIFTAEYFISAKRYSPFHLYCLFI